MTERLRLRAVDAEDLSVIAACLQDALIPLSEMAYLADERRFMAAFTRFQRERLVDPNQPEGLAQSQSVLVLHDIEAVKFRGLDSRFGAVRFELLTLISEPAEGGLSHHAAVCRRRRDPAARQNDRRDARGFRRPMAGDHPAEPRRVVGAPRGGVIVVLRLDDRRARFNLAALLARHARAALLAARRRPHERPTMSAQA